MRVTRHGVIFVSMLLVYCIAFRNGGSAEEASRIGQVLATYRVDLAGFNLGEFQLTVDLKGSAYALKASGRFSILGGMLYQGAGTTSSTGTLTKSTPEPSRFDVDYDDGGEREQRSIRHCQTKLA